MHPAENILQSESSAFFFYSFRIESFAVVANADDDLISFTRNIDIYIFGIGTGTMLGNLVFIFGGKLIASKINNNQPILNWVIGGIFAITAIIQLWKMFNKKDVRHRLDHPEAETKQFEEKVEDINTPDEIETKA